MIITLIGLTVIGFILAYAYIEADRQEIQKKQEALQKAQEALDARLKEQERLRHEAFMNKPYEGGV
jgi:hypothetical protein